MMAEKTAIEYSHHSWSPWWGCFKIREGCQNCYARAFAKRWGHDCWGLDPRRMLSDNHWKQPLKWNRAAEKAGERRRVLVSMCDPFENLPELNAPQTRLFRLIDATPNLDWLLWTKRPEGIDVLLPEPPPNVWLGVSCSTQKDVDEMMPVLQTIPARVHAMSLEPLVKAVDLRPWLYLCSIPKGDGSPCGEPGCLESESLEAVRRVQFLDWIIVGGESGPGRRRFEVQWAQDIHDQCKAAGVPFYMKQDSGPKPGTQGRIPDELWAVKEFPEMKARASR